MSNANRWIISILSVIALLIAAFIWLRSHVFDRLDVSIEKRLTSLKLSGFNVHYDSLSVDWWDGVIKVDKLVLEKNAYDTTCIYPEFISVERVRAEGIGLLQLVFNSTLSVESIYLDQPNIVLRENSVLELDSASEKENEFTLLADHVHIRSGNFTFTDSAACKLIAEVKSDLSVAGLALDFHIGSPFKYGADILTMNGSEIQMPRDFYTMKVAEVNMNFLERALTIDSIRIIPAFGPVAFGRKHGFEIDRFEGLIPYFRANDLSFSFEDTAVVKSRSAEIQFYLKVFRDKRLRFVVTKKLLPVSQLRSLPFALHIDTLKVTKSYVQYDEIAEGTVEPGRVFFDNLYAEFRNVDNTSHKGEMQLTARSNLLGHGSVNLFATFPLAELKRSTVTGSVENFNLPELNPMLTPTTRLMVESGKMKKLSFNFTFNTVRADGKIDMNYENLKVVSFKDEEKTKGEELEKDNFKTFIMNAFVFRKNMDEDVPEDKRTGTIMYLRDDSRSVFNFWVKSVLSGIKSAYNMDKAEAKKSGREIKKEERLSRREARKAKRAEKKKERG
jgi:hypothetical protein